MIRKFADVFGAAAQTPIWFCTWIVMFFVWAAAHIYLGHFLKWYTADMDFVVVSLLFSAVPFWVENSLKHAQWVATQIQHKQLSTLTDLTLAIREALDQSMDRDNAAAQRDEVIRDLATKILDAIEDHTGEVIPA